jgi:DNA repair protein RecO (recombination protein O)
MEWSEPGIAIGTRRHGETDVILEAMTAGHGRHLGLVKGGRSRRLRPVLQAGNTLQLTWRARLHEHLGNFRAEPLTERSAGLTHSSVGAFGLALAGAHLRLLPERDPHPRLYEALALLLDCLDPASPEHSSGFAEAGRPALAGELMVRFELLLLDELGFGLDLERCAATGNSADLAYVSPKSGRAVSRAAGLRYAERLFALPRFLTEPAGKGTCPEALNDGFRLTGYFLERHVHEPRGQTLPATRASFLNALHMQAKVVA